MSTEIKTYRSGIKKVPKNIVSSAKETEPVKAEMLKWYRSTRNALKAVMAILGIDPCDKCGK